MGKRCSQEKHGEGGGSLGPLARSQGECPFLPGSSLRALHLVVATSYVGLRGLGRGPCSRASLVNVSDSFHH